MKKRIGSLFLVLALFLMLMPSTALAEDDAPAAETEKTSITSVDELLQLVKTVDAGKSDIVVSLDADLDLTGVEWTPIAGKTAYEDETGFDVNYFSGIFYGNNHVISGLDLSKAYGDQYMTGFFGALKNARVYDLTVKGSFDAPEVSDYLWLGSIAGYSEDSVVSNCVSEVSFNNQGRVLYGPIGMIGETHNTLIEYCENKGTFTFTNDMGSSYVGGIAGAASDNTKIQYCANTAEMTLLATNSGEIAGALTSGSTIENCFANGKLTVLGTATMNNVSGIAGTVYNGTTISNSYFSGELDLSQYSAVPPYGRLGGIGGQIYSGSPSFVNDYYTETANVYACGRDTAARDGVLAKSSDYMKTREFYDEITAGGGNYRYEEGSTPLLPEPSYEVSFDIVPTELEDVIITVDDKEVTAPIVLENGTHKFTVTAKDCESFSGEFTLSADPDTHIQKVTMSYLPADYTKVDAAIEKANSLNKTDYRDFSAVDTAVEAVVRGKNITEQAEVDAMAKSIEDAINALVRKGSGGGGGSSSPVYSVTVPGNTENGTVTVSPKNASAGSTVTITVKPDDGYQLNELTVNDKNGNKMKLNDKGDGVYTFTMPTGNVDINAAFASKTETSPFNDVSADAYYYEAVKWAVEQGITGGTGSGLFGPDQPCIRAQIVTFLWRAAGSPEPKNTGSFTDVSADSYYAKAVAWAVENGITTGTGDDKFSPDATCTRAQSVTFLFRAIGKSVDSKVEFRDVLTDSYYANAVAWAVENGVTNGIGNGLFGPDNSCTRAQIVTFLYRAYKG